MAQPYLFLAVGVVAAVTALIIWLNNERPQEQQVPSRRRSSRTNSTRQPPEPDSECMICCERAVTTKFMPCQHACMCGECASKFTHLCEERNFQNTCPYCRAPIQAFKRL